MEMIEFLRWVMSPVGAGIIAYWIVGKINDKNMTELQERLVAYAIAAALSMVGYGLILAVYPGEAALPVGWRDWMTTLFRIGSEAFGLATIIHAVKLGRVPQYLLVRDRHPK